MRLIDADKLMEYCLNLKEKKVDCNDIARFPTAYNVDEVVKELKEHRKESILFQHEAELQGSIVNYNYFGGKRNAYADAIEIVKAGGKNDD